MNAGWQRSVSRILYSRLGVSRRGLRASSATAIYAVTSGIPAKGLALICVVAMYLVAGAPPAAQDCVGFFEREVGGPGLSRAEAVAAGDLDGDGDVDLVAVSSGDNRVTWFESDFTARGIQPPSFTQRVVSTTAIGATAVEVADFNQDGHLDILVSNQGFDQVVLFRNNGAQPPAFFEQSLSTNTPRPITSRVLDFDGDGDSDALVGAFGSGGIFLFENQLVGSVLSFERSNLTANVPGLRDFDVLDVGVDASDHDADDMTDEVDIGDGDKDLVALSLLNNELVWLDSNPGTGVDDEGNDIEIQVYTAYKLDDITGPDAIRLSDVDGDGDIDLLVAASGEDSVIWYERGNGEDAFQPFDSENPLDINGDGVDDVIQPNFIRHVIDADAGGARSMFVGDIDNDGDDDLLVAHSFADRLVWYENSGTAPDRFIEREVGSLPGPRSAIAVDLNGDDILDPVSASFLPTVPTSETRVTWFETSTANPPAFTARTLAVGSRGARSMVSVDVDGANGLDVVATDGRALYWMANDGTPEPAWPIEILDTDAAGADSLQAVVIDSTLYLLTAQEDDGSVALYEQISTTPPMFTKSFVVTGRGAPRAVVIDLIDDDTELDLVVAFRDENRVSWFKGPGFTEEFPVTSETPGEETLGVVVLDTGDVDGDGDIDVVTGARDESSIAVHFQEPGVGGAPPTFTRQRLTSNDPDADLAFQTQGPRSIEVADLNGDMMMDILSASALDSTIAWFRNVGVPEGETELAFTRIALSITATAAEQASAIDVDDDGDLDVVSVAPRANVISWRENNGEEDPAFTFHPLPTSGDRPQVAVVDDFNGDGKKDFFAGFLVDRSWFSQGGEICQDFDVNADDIIDGTELAWLIQGFGRAVDDPPTQWWSVVDFNLDGTVDGLDLAVLSGFSVWGESTSTCAYTCQ